jgi:twinkle protein
MKTHQTCPRCGHHDCYTIFDDEGGYCHSCSYKHSVKTQEINLDQEAQAELKSYRDIDKSVVEKYNVLTGVNNEGVDVSRIYPYPHKNKLRILPKDFSQNKGFTLTHLFGMDKFDPGGKTITITEGEDDALAAYQMLNAEKYGQAVVSLPSSSAGKSSKFLKSVFEYVNSFETVILAFDNDDAGEQAASKFAVAFPNKCYRVRLSKHKDACDYLSNNDQQAFRSAWFNRVKYVPDWDVNTTEQFLNILESGKDWVYVPTGIQAYDDIALGLMQGGLTVFTAPEGIGKTEFMRMLEYQLISEHPDIPFAYCHMEETNMRSILGLASYKLNKNVTRRALIEDIDEVKNAIRSITERENVHQFNIGIDEDPEVLLERAKYYANVCDCKYLFFEPIQDLAHQRSNPSETVEQLLSKVSVQLSRIASETGMGIITIAHQNDNGEIRDCRLIGKQAAVRVDLHRELMATDEDTRNTTTLTVVKNRPVGPTGFAGQLMFDSDSFTLREKVY